MTIEQFRSRGNRSGGKGPFRYRNLEDNHVIWPGREKALNKFVQQTYGKLQHKLRNAHSSNSEDALTWSCFDTLSQLPTRCRQRALSELWELAYGATPLPAGVASGSIHIGKRYPSNPRARIATEVDASIEGDGTLVFIEAKLYSPMSAADEKKNRNQNQIERKLTVGLREASSESKEFFFIILDIAPPEALRTLQPRVKLAKASAPESASGFSGKWLTAYWFDRYKFGRRGSLAPLQKVIDDAGLHGINAERVAANMGWLTWADVYKAVLRATVTAR